MNKIKYSEFIEKIQVHERKNTAYLSPKNIDRLIPLSMDHIIKKMTKNQAVTFDRVSEECGKNVSKF